MARTERRAFLSQEYALRVLRRRWWVILACMIVTPLAAFALARAQTNEYTATASLLFTNTSVAQQASGLQAVSQTDPQGQRNTNLTLVQLGTSVSPTVAQRLGGGLTAKQVHDAVTASLTGQSNVVAVAATWTSPKMAALIANGFVKAFIEQQRRSDQATVQDAIDLVEQQYTALPKAQRQTPQGQSLLDHLESLKILKTLQNSTKQVQTATPPTSPSSPKVALDTILGAIAGLILGVALALLLERIDRRLREPRDIEEAYGLPVLGLVPRGFTIESLRSHADVTLEPFRMLRAHLRYFNVDRELKILLVTSARPAEGKSTVACNLAATTAGMGTRTLLIEADLRKPALARRLSLKPSAGLSGALVNVAAEDEAIQHVELGLSADGMPSRTMSVLAAGAVPPNPTELLESQAMERLLDWARLNFDLVILDSAPMSVVADTISLVNRVDGVIIISRLGVSTRDSAGYVRERLDNLGTPALGVVINDIPVRDSAYYGYGYYGEPKAQARFPGRHANPPLTEVREPDGDSPVHVDADGMPHNDGQEGMSGAAIGRDDIDETVPPG